MLTLLAVVVGSYLLGALPVSFLLTRWLTGVDLREVGSGNIGATNAGRVLGWKGGVAILMWDAGKGGFAVWASTQVAGLELWMFPPEWLRAMAAGGVILGHVFPIFLGGKGGKGVATTAGAFLALEPLAMGIAATVFAVVAAISRYVSVGSILAAVALPLALYQLESPVHYQWLGRVVASLVIVLHGPNLKRLWQGIEPKIGMRVKPNE